MLYGSSGFLGHTRLVLALLITAPVVPAIAGPPAALSGASAAARAAGFAVSAPVRSLEVVPPRSADPSAVDVGGPPRSVRNPNLKREDDLVPPDDGMDAAVQVAAPLAPMAAPTLAFDGLSNADNYAVHGFRVAPPDPSGDVGPGHYVQQTNLLVRVFDKSGAPLTPPFKLSSLFAPLGGQCAAADRGDPIVVYDSLADRWLLSQFGFTSTGTPPYHQCVAVSRTGDPTGEYYLYDFIVPNSELNDYPKLGLWPDAYYMAVNQFTGGLTFNGTGAYAFDRVKMIAGDPTASFVYFNLSLAAFPEAIGGMLPAHLDGLQTPPAGSPNVFAYFVATEFGDPIDGLRLFDFHVDFATPANSTFVEREGSPVTVAPFNPRNPNERDDILQFGQSTSTLAALDAIADRLMYRLHYRTLGNGESLVVTHTVNAGTGATRSTYRAGVRYYLLRTDRPGGAFRVAEQGTFAPDDGLSRWMGSAAIDHEGNLAIGYSVSGTTLHPSLRFAGRLASDPPGALTRGEGTLAAGTGIQTSTGSRWGDYSHITLDPDDDCTFWYTGEYYTAESQASSGVGWLTRIGRFRFDECAPVPRGTLQGTITECATGAPVTRALVTLSSGHSRETSAAGTYSLVLTPGGHGVTARAPGFDTAPSATVTLVAGGTVTRNLCLGPGVSDSGADLTVSNLKVPARVVAGVGFPVRDTIRNLGPSGASTSTTAFYFSGNAAWSPDDMLLTSRPVPAIGSGADHQATTTVTLPGATPAGRYFLLAVADAPAGIAEANEGNNVESRPVLVGPDLQVAALAAPPRIAAGGTAAVTLTIVNRGADVAAPTKARLHLGGSAKALGAPMGTLAVPALPAGASFTGSITMTVPSGTPVGDTKLWAVADAAQGVAESRETNNTRGAVITIH